VLDKTLWVAYIQIIYSLSSFLVYYTPQFTLTVHLRFTYLNLAVSRFGYNEFMLIVRVLTSEGLQLIYLIPVYDHGRYGLLESSLLALHGRYCVRVSLLGVSKRRIWLFARLEKWIQLGGVLIVGVRVRRIL